MTLDPIKPARLRDLAIVSEPDSTTRDGNDPEAVRLAHLRTESNVKSVGQLCYLVAFFSLLGTLEFLLVAKGIWPPPPELKSIASPDLTRLVFWVLTFVLLLNTIGQVVLGHGLVHLQVWARWTVVALTALSLASYSSISLACCWVYPLFGVLSLVIGGLIHVLIVYPLLTPRSSMVFSATYRELIRKTPGIKSGMHWLLKILIGLILVGFFGTLALLAAIVFGDIETDWIEHILRQLTPAGANA